MAAAASATRSVSGSSVAIRTKTRSSRSSSGPRAPCARSRQRASGPQIQLKSLYGQIGYDFPGMRLDITRADGQREIQVVSGTFAWNEIDKIGGGLQPGWGSAVPAMETVTDRLLRLWTTPIGLYKAAATASAKAQVTIENGAVVLTFPFTAGKPMHHDLCRRRAAGRHAREGHAGLALSSGARRGPVSRSGLRDDLFGIR